MRFWIAVCVAVLGLNVSVLAADAFIPGTEDVPLADGLVLVDTDADVLFDTPAGQILIVEAVGESVDADTIHSFYQRTLPALGWQQNGVGAFERESETLTISVEQTQPVRIRFELAPRDL